MLNCTLIRYHKGCWFILTARRWSWKSKPVKECVLQNGLAPRMDGAQAGDRDTQTGRHADTQTHRQTHRQTRTHRQTHDIRQTTSNNQPTNLPTNLPTNQPTNHFAWILHGVRGCVVFDLFSNFKWARSTVAASLNFWDKCQL